MHCQWKIFRCASFTFCVRCNYMQKMFSLSNHRLLNYFFFFWKCMINMLFFNSYLLRISILPAWNEFMIMLFSGNVAIWIAWLNAVLIKISFRFCTLMNKKAEKYIYHSNSFIIRFKITWWLRVKIWLNYYCL